MSSREKSICKKGFIHGLPVIGLVALLAGCAVLLEGGSSDSRGTEELQNRFTVPPQVSPPGEIQSVQLYRSGSPLNPPVIRLGSGEQLTLAFDYLGSSAKQFIARVQHYSSRWSESGLNPNFYIDGFFEDYFGGGLKSFSQRPSYYHFEYAFPNPQFSLEVSGNYLLSIHDADSGELLFTLPFFVSEEEGTLQTRVDKLFARRNDLREQDQLFSRYRYPGFVEMPSFDLKFYYVQNRFWGRAKSVELFDTSTPGAVHFHLSQEESFLGDYEFRTLDIRTLRADGNRIISFEPGATPPRIVLRRDVQSFSPDLISRRLPRPGFGIPIDKRDAQYAEIEFRLETRENGAGASGQKIYLVGDFNDWTISERNRVEFDEIENLWSGRAMAKQGEYAYKYVTLEDNRINDLSLDRSFTFTRQEYVTLVYFRDPTRHFDRLLRVAHTPN